MNVNSFKASAIVLALCVVSYYFWSKDLDGGAAHDSFVVATQLQWVASVHNSDDGVVKVAELEVRLGLIENDLSEAAKLPMPKHVFCSSCMDKILRESSDAVASVVEKQAFVGSINSKARQVSEYGRAVLDLYAALPSLYKSLDDYYVLQSAHQMSLLDRAGQSRSVLYDRADREHYDESLKYLLRVKSALDSVAECVERIREINSGMQWVPEENRLDLNFLSYF